MKLTIKVRFIDTKSKNEYSEMDITLPLNTNEDMCVVIDTLSFNTDVYRDLPSETEGD